MSTVPFQAIPLTPHDIEQFNAYNFVKDTSFLNLSYDYPFYDLIKNSNSLWNIIQKAFCIPHKPFSVISSEFDDSFSDSLLSVITEQYKWNPQSTYLIPFNKQTLRHRIFTSDALTDYSLPDSYPSHSIMFFNWVCVTDASPSLKWAGSYKHFSPDESEQHFPNYFSVVDYFDLCFNFLIANGTIIPLGDFSNPYSFLVNSSHLGITSTYHPHVSISFPYLNISKSKYADHLDSEKFDPKASPLKYSLFSSIVLDYTPNYPYLNDFKNKFLASLFFAIQFYNSIFLKLYINPTLHHDQLKIKELEEKVVDLMSSSQSVSIVSNHYTWD